MKAKVNGKEIFNAIKKLLCEPICGLDDCYGCWLNNSDLCDEIKNKTVEVEVIDIK